MLYSLLLLLASLDEVYLESYSKVLQAPFKAFMLKIIAQLAAHVMVYIKQISHIVIRRFQRTEGGRREEGIFLSRLCC